MTCLDRSGENGRIRFLDFEHWCQPCKNMYGDLSWASKDYDDCTDGEKETFRREPCEGSPIAV